MRHNTDGEENPEVRIVVSRVKMVSIYTTGKKRQLTSVCNHTS